MTDMTAETNNDMKIREIIEWRAETTPQPSGAVSMP